MITEIPVEHAIVVGLREILEEARVGEEVLRERALAIQGLRPKREQLLTLNRIRKDLSLIEIGPWVVTDQAREPQGQELEILANQLNWNQKDPIENHEIHDRESVLAEIVMSGRVEAQVKIKEERRIREEGLIPAETKALLKKGQVPVLRLIKRRGERVLELLLEG